MSNECHRHLLGFRTQVFTRKMGNLFGGKRLLLLLTKRAMSFVNTTARSNWPGALEHCSRARKLVLDLRRPGGTQKMLH